MSQFNSQLRLRDVAPDYDALFCDAWGVIHNGINLFDGVVEALNRFREFRGPVVILTNAPRPSHVIPAQLDRLGVPPASYDRIVTSGDAVRAEIEKRSETPIFLIGPDKDDDLYTGLDLNTAPIQEAKTIICTGLFDEKNETPEDYRDLLEAAASRGIEMICANPDIQVRLGNRLIYCAGALAALYEALGGHVIHAGKPHAPIYDLARIRERESHLAKPDPRILVLGDGLYTDIQGANRENIDAVFVYGAGGIHAGGNAPEAVKGSLDEAGVTAIGGMEQLRW